jgi:hypothetical protein
MGESLQREGSPNGEGGSSAAAAYKRRSSPATDHSQAHKQQWHSRYSATKLVPDLDFIKDFLEISPRPHPGFYHPPLKLVLL